MTRTTAVRLQRGWRSRSASSVGRWSVHGDRVRHAIVFSFFPNWNGTTQERRAVLAGDRLRLTTDPHVIQGRVREAVLEWERDLPGGV